MKLHTWPAALTVCLALGGAASASATTLDVKASGTKTFYVDERAGANQVIISSESTIEDFTSVANKVAGQFQLDPKQLEGIRGRFSIHVADIQTGIDLRDRDLQTADWLDATRYPLIAVEVAHAEDVRKKNANSAELILVGTYSLHGVTQEMRVPATLIYLDESPQTRKRASGDLISLRASFGIKLSDFHVTGPKTSETIGLKVADLQRIRASLFASSEPPPAPLESLAPTPATQPSPGGPATTAPSRSNVPVLPPPQRPTGQ